jgi:O-antigen/teichoic acid export membrane protein
MSKRPTTGDLGTTTHEGLEEAAPEGVEEAEALAAAPLAAPPGMVGRLRGLAGGAIAQTFAGTAAIAGLNIVTGVILARALGPTARGELAAAILWPTLMRFVAMLGSIEAINYRAARPNTDLKRLTGTILGLAGLQSAAMLVVGAGLLPLVLSGYGSSTLVACFIYLITVCTGMFGLYLVSILSGTHRFGPFNVLRVLVIGVQTLALGALAVTGELTVLTAAFCYLAGVVPTTLAALAIVRKQTGRFKRPSKELMGSLASFGFKAQLGSTRNPLNEQLDQFFVSIFLSATQLGLYTVAYAFSALIGLVSGTVATVALPTSAASDDSERSAGLARRYIGWTFISSLIVALPLVALASPIIEIAFGEKFGGAASVAQILLAASVMTALTRVSASVLSGLGRPGDSGVAGILSLGGTAVAIAILLPPLGIDGAAIGTLLGFTASSLWCLIRLGKALDVVPLTLLLPPRRSTT